MFCHVLLKFASFSLRRLSGTIIETRSADDATDEMYAGMATSEAFWMPRPPRTVGCVDLVSIIVSDSLLAADMLRAEDP